MGKYKGKYKMENSNKTNLLIKLKKAAAAVLASCIFFNIAGQSFAQALQPSKPALPAYLTYENFSKDSGGVALNLAFSTIPSTLSYEQVKNALAKEYPVEDESFFKQAYNIYKQAVVAEETAIAQAAAQIAKKELDGCTKRSINTRSVRGYGDNVVDNSCFKSYEHAQGALRYYLKEGIGATTSIKKYQWNKEIMLTYAPILTDIIAVYGANAKDTPVLQKYFRLLVQDGGDYCDNDFYMADIAPGLAGGKGAADARDGKALRAVECERLTYALTGLALLDVNAADKSLNAQQIYKLLKDSYKDDYGALLLSAGVSSLMLIATDEAYKLLDAFLLKDSLADGLNLGSIWQGLGSVFDIISVNAWGRGITNLSNKAQGRAGRYNNRITERFNYIDADTARAYGLSDFTIALAKEGHNAYKMPYGNLFEDIGLMLASSNDKRAKLIAAKAANLYMASVKRNNNISGTPQEQANILRTANNFVHVPLAVGAIAGGAGSQDIVKQINNFDWWDLNEGTQRRVNNLMLKPAKAKGIAGVTLHGADAAKAKRAATNRKVESATVWADIAISAVLLTQLIASLPSIARSAYTLSRAVNIRIAGKGKVLKSVSAQIKAQGISPKLARYQKLTAQKTAKAAPKTAAAPAAQPKAQPQKPLNPADVEIIGAGNSAQLRFKWQLQQPKTPAATNVYNQLSVQIGEGSGASGAAISGSGTTTKATAQTSKNIADKVRASNTQKPLSGPAQIKNYTPKPQKTVDNARVDKAIRQANLAAFKDAVQSIGRTLRTKTGGLLLSVNLSLMNPVALNAAQAGNAFNLSARGAGLTTELVSGGGGLSKALGGSGNIYHAFSAPLKAAPAAVKQASYAQGIVSKTKSFLGFKQAAPLRANTGLPGSGFRMPKGMDLKKDVQVFYVDKATRAEVKLPLTFNIDKGIKVTNRQRAVFNEDYRLEIRNGSKKPQKIEGFKMLLENTPKARLSFIDAVKTSAVDKFRLKIQMPTEKTSRHFKDFEILGSDLQTPLPVALQAPRDIIAADETLFLDQNGNISAVNEQGKIRILNNATFRIPKGEIENIINVLKTAGTDFVFDIRPTQNKALPFILSLLSATTIMAFAPAFKEIFGLSTLTANTLMGIISFGPAIMTPFLGVFFKKYGMVNVMKTATLLSLSGVVITALSGFYGYASEGSNIAALILASAGLTALSLSNEIKFSTMSPLLEANFEENKAMSVTTQALMARSLGTIFFLQFPALFNAAANLIGIPVADETISVAGLLLPLAAIAALKMFSAKLRDLHITEESNLSPLTLWKTFKTNGNIRNGAAAFIMFESFEATLSLLLFQMAKAHYPAASDIPGILGGVAIYGAMALSRYIVGKLQKQEVLNGPQTYLLSAAAAITGLVTFALGGISTAGLFGAALAFMGTSNFFPPLYSATKNRSPEKAGEISLIFFTATTLAALSTMVLGAVIDATGSTFAGFAVPLASIIAGLAFSSYVLRDSPAFKAAVEKAYSAIKQASDKIKMQANNNKPLQD